MTDPGTTLRQAGLRVTAARLATLAVVQEHPHSDADQVAALVRGRLGSVSRQAVYDVLAALTEANLLRRVAANGTRARYEIQNQDNHHHVVCKNCGAIDDVPCHVGEAPCLAPADDHGYAVQVAEVLYLGLCPDCRAAAVTSQS